MYKPDVIVNIPVAANVILLLTEIPFELFIVKLFRFEMLDGINTPAVEPLKTRLEVAIVDKLVAVPAIARPLRVKVFAPTAKVPAVKVNWFVIVALDVRLTPLAAFMVKLIAPVNPLPVL